MSTQISRRHVVGAALATAALPLVDRAAGATTTLYRAAHEDKRPAFRYALNTATIRGQNLPFDQQCEVAAKAGYDSIEPWIGDIQAFKDKGGSLGDMKKRIADSGLTVESAIGFAAWIVDDDAQRAKGLEQARRDMDLLVQIGGTGMAAPPAGATENAKLDLRAAADRYRALLEIGDQTGVVPQVEVWGFSKCLSRLGDCTLVAIETGHEKACVLTDVYHLFKGGTDFDAMRLLNAGAMRALHMNDYPEKLPREKINDADRIYPGDGIAPCQALVRTVCDAGFRGIFSLELFNRTYWKQDANEVARTGLDKMKRVVEAALA